MDYDAYQCECCGHIQKTYIRECPMCHQEKTHKWQENLLLKNMLINLITSTEPELLQNICEMCGMGWLNTDELLDAVKGRM